MIQLIRYELENLLKKKWTIVALVIIAIFILMPSFIECRTIKNDFGNLENYKTMSKGYHGISMEEAKRRFDTAYKKNEAINKKETTMELTMEEKIALKNFNYTAKSKKYVINDEKLNHEEIKEKLIELKGENLQDSYEYKNLEKADSMISKLDKENYRYTAGWNYITDFNVGATLTVILLVVGLASIFSNDYNSNTSQIILSTKEGKRKGVTAKIIAGIIYGSLTFIFVNGMNFLSGSTLGIDGWNVKATALYGVTGTPFNFTVIKYYFLTLGVVFVGTILFALSIMLCSLLFKNIIPTILIGLALYFVSPEAIGLNCLQTLSNMSLATIIRGKHIFGTYITFNIFGTPVMQYMVIGIVAMIILLTTTVLLKYFGKTQTIA